MPDPDNASSTAPPPWTVTCFLSPDCPHCASVLPALERAEAATSRVVRFVKFDREASPDQFQRFAVKSVPTFILFKRGGIREIARGGSAETIAWIDSLCELAD